jgi:perosamine synthetase
MKVPYYVPWINDSDKKIISKSINSRWLTNGPYLEKFQNKIKYFIGSKFALGVGSATQGLHLSLKSLGIRSGDEVIVPSFTFAATANAVIYCGAKPIFVDIQTDSFNINPDVILDHISDKTKAIIPVHYGGQSCDMNEILNIANKNNLFVVEDCAHSLGSTYKKKHCGNLGDLGCFSFYPTKIITTGEGGMITTNNKKLDYKIKILRSQGMNILPHQREKNSEWEYDIIDLGYNYRLDEIRSALGFSQSRRINSANNARIRIAKKYNNFLKNVKGIKIPIIKNNRNHIFHLYTIKITDDFPISRNELFKKLTKQNIGTSVQYKPLHLMTYYKKNFPQTQDDFPISNIIKDQILCLPIYPSMTDKQIRYVVNAIISD